MKDTWRFSKWLLVALMTVMIVAAVLCIRSRDQMERQLGYENQYIYSIWAMQNAALKSDKEQAAKMLFELQDEPFRRYTPVRLSKHMEILVKEERKRARRDIIDYLRLQTGKDLGEQPGPWILEYGDPTYKDLQKQLDRNEPTLR